MSLEPLVDKLRRLSTVLAPNFRVSGGEVADVLSALIAVAEHGDPLLEAADAGAQAVADFFHQHIADNRPEGSEEPQRGAPVENLPTTVAGQPAPAPAVSQRDFAQLAAAVQQLTNLVTAQAQQNQPAPEETPDAPPAPADPPPASDPNPPSEVS